jgi:hypothetical protein
MEDKPFIKEEPFNLVDEDGKEHRYILSNFDAVEGRRIVSQYPMTGLPKVGNYDENEKLMLRLMHYVAVVTSDGRKLRLSTMELINNHVPHFEMLAKIEMKMMEKNCSFFRDGRSLDFLDNLAQIFSRQILEMLTLSSGQSSGQEKQPSMSSEPSMT